MAFQDSEEPEAMKSKIVQNALFLTLSDVYSKLVGFFLVILMTRYLGELGFGQYSFVFAFVGFTALIGDFGVSYILLRKVSRKDKDWKKYFSNILSLKILLSVLFILLTIIASFFIKKEPLIMYSLWIVALLQGINAVSNVYYMYLYGTNTLKPHALAVFFERTWALLLGFVVLYFSRSVFLFIVVTGFGQFIQSSTYFFAARKHCPSKLEFDKQFIYHQCLKPGLPFFFTAVFLLINYRISILMISFMIGDSAVGLYSAAYRFVENLAFIPVLITSAILPSMNLLFVKNKALLNALFNRALRYVLMLSFPLTVGGILLAGRILGFFYGANFMAATSSFKLLFLAELLIFVTFLLGNLLNSVNLESKFTFAIIVGSAVNVVANLFLIPLLGFYGAAISTLISEVFILVILLMYANNIISFDLKKLLKPFFASLVMGLIIYFLQSVPIIVLFILGALTYLGALLLLGLEKEDKELLMYFYAKLKTKLSKF